MKPKKIANYQKEGVGFSNYTITFNNKQCFIFLILFITFIATISYTSFAVFTKQDTIKKITFVAGTLSYDLTSNDLNSQSQITVPAGATKKIFLTVKSNNNIDSKYKLYYQVPGSSNLPSNVDIGYTSTSVDVPSGVIEKGTTKNITLRIKNKSSSSVTFQIGIDGGLINNDVILTKGNEVNHILDGDVVIPIITATDSIASNNWHASSFTLNFTGNSGNSEVVYYYGTTPTNLNQIGTSVFVSTNTSGITYYVKACNDSCTSVVSYIAKLDTTTPSIAFNSNVKDYMMSSNNVNLLTSTTSSNISGTTYTCTSGGKTVATISNLSYGNNTVTCTANTGAGKKVTIAKNVFVYQAGQYVLKNLIENGSFEEGITGWEIPSYYGVIEQSANFYTNGKYGLKVNASTPDHQSLSYTSYTLTYQKGHVYYATANSYNYSSDYTAILLYDYLNWKTTNYTISSGYKPDQKAKLSIYLDQNWETFDSLKLRLDNYTTSNNGIVYFDSVVLVDLTQTFGAGNEPNQEWCDDNINYFDGYMSM